MSRWKKKAFPYLFEVKDLSKSAIIYNNKIVQKPSKEKITKSKGNVNSIMDLK